MEKENQRKIILGFVGENIYLFGLERSASEVGWAAGGAAADNGGESMAGG